MNRRGSQAQEQQNHPCFFYPSLEGRPFATTQRGTTQRGRGPRRRKDAKGWICRGQTEDGRPPARLKMEATMQQLEMEILYDTRPGNGQQRYQVHVYFFVPAELEAVNTNMYQDVWQLVRLRTPKIALAALAAGIRRDLILKQVADALETGHRLSREAANTAPGKHKEDLERASCRCLGRAVELMRLESCIFRAAIRREVDNIVSYFQTPGPPEQQSRVAYRVSLLVQQLSAALKSISKVCKPFICEASQSSAFHDWHEAWRLVEEFLLVESESAILKLLRHIVGKAAPEGAVIDVPGVDLELSRHAQSGIPQNASCMQHGSDSQRDWAEGTPLEWRLTRSLASSRVIYEQWSRQTSMLIDDSEASGGDMLREMSTQLEQSQHLSRLSALAAATRQQLQGTAMRDRACAPEVHEHATSMSNPAYVPSPPLQAANPCGTDMDYPLPHSDCAGAARSTDESACMPEVQAAKADRGQGAPGPETICGLSVARKLLCQAARELADARKSRGFSDTTVRPDDPYHNEIYINRLKKLKHNAQTAMNLYPQCKNPSTALADAVGMVVAGTAMAWAIGSLWLAERFSKHQGQWQPIYILILILGYILKDRIKEWGKRYLQPTAEHFGVYFPDRILKLVDQRGKVVGRSVEDVKTSDASSVDKHVRDFRHKGAPLPPGLRAAVKPERVVSYRKFFDVYWDHLDPHLRHTGGVSDIMRFDIRRYCRRMQPEEETHLVLTSDEEVQKVVCHRVYHLNIVVCIQMEGKPGPTLQMEKARLTVSHRGIVRLEPFRSSLLHKEQQTGTVATVVTSIGSRISRGVSTIVNRMSSTVHRLSDWPSNKRTDSVLCTSVSQAAVPPV